MPSRDIKDLHPEITKRWKLTKNAFATQFPELPQPFLTQTFPGAPPNISLGALLTHIRMKSEEKLQALHLTKVPRSRSAELIRELPLHNVPSLENIAKNEEDKWVS